MCFFQHESLARPRKPSKRAHRRTFSSCTWRPRGAARPHEDNKDQPSRDHDLATSSRARISLAAGKGTPSLAPTLSLRCKCSEGNASACEEAATRTGCHQASPCSGARAKTRLRRRRALVATAPPKRAPKLAWIQCSPFSQQGTLARCCAGTRGFRVQRRSGLSAPRYLKRGRG